MVFLGVRFLRNTDWDKDLKNISKLLANSWEFRYIAAMFISDLAVATTIFGNGLLRSKVCIKVFTLRLGKPRLQVITLMLSTRIIHVC